MNPITAAQIESTLQAALNPVALQVTDDSHQHAGHSGNPDGAGGTHFSVHIVSERFEGLSRVARHRLVYDALQNFVARGLHALAIQAHTPTQAPR
jgi:BolA protein